MAESPRRYLARWDQCNLRATYTALIKWRVDCQTSATHSLRLQSTRWVIYAVVCMIYEQTMGFSHPHNWKLAISSPRSLVMIMSAQIAPRATPMIGTGQAEIPSLRVTTFLVYQLLISCSLPAKHDRTQEGVRWKSTLFSRAVHFICYLKPLISVTMFNSSPRKRPWPFSEVVLRKICNSLLLVSSAINLF